MAPVLAIDHASMVMATRGSAVCSSGYSQSEDVQLALYAACPLHACVAGISTRLSQKLSDTGASLNGDLLLGL